MELRDAHDDDLHTEKTAENTNIKLELELHPGGDTTQPSENVNYTDDIDNTVEVKTEVIDDDRYQHMDIHCNRGMCSNSKYNDSGMIHDVHVPHVKSEQDDVPLETHDQTEFIIEIDTCKHEYYHAYPNIHDDVNLEQVVVEQEPGEHCVTKEDVHMKHIDTQHQRWLIHTSADTKLCTVVVRDIRYTYPETIKHGSVLIHGAAPTVPIHTQPIYVNVSDKPPQKQFTCSGCTAGFRKNSSLKTHMLIHTGEKPHKCSICEVSFSEKGGLTRHTRMHTGEKPYKCSVCGVGFAHMTSLKRHILIHTGEKPHKCYVCEVSFARKDSLASHMRTHTGEKPYKCSDCGIEFTEASNLKRHTRTHTGEKPHKCPVCEVSFREKGDLTSHMRTHTGEKPYPCTVCGVGFTQSANLRRHTRIHTGEKPHICPVCGVSFSDKSNLVKHRRVHTGEKPYLCFVCGVGFTQKCNLTTHTRLHTGSLTNVQNVNVPSQIEAV